MGRVARAHGIRGELRVQPLTDQPARAFAPGAHLDVAGSRPGEPDRALPTFEVESVRPHHKLLLVKLRGIDDRSEADLLRGRILLREVDPDRELGAGEAFQHELVGMSVETPAGESLGTVIEIYDLEPREILEVRGERGSFLLPLARDIVHAIDRERGRVVASPPEGLLDL